jgi:hypothetical protein
MGWALGNYFFLLKHGTHVIFTFKILFGGFRYVVNIGDHIISVIQCS